MKALVIDGSVRDIEKRDIDVFKYYHAEVAQLFIECDETVSIGDRYVDGKFVKDDMEG